MNETRKKRVRPTMPDATPDRRSSSTASSMLSLLGEDALLQVLVRTCSEDHEALRCTCSLFRRLLDSKTFRRERALSEWAEVEAFPLTAEELYLEDNEVNSMESDDESSEPMEWHEDESFFYHYSDLGYRNEQGIIRNRFEITVDGQRAGGGWYHLIPRYKRHYYGSLGGGLHSDCNDISDACLSMSLALFDRNGRPRLNCIREELRKHTVRHYHPHSMLFLDSFKLNPEYREGSSWVGAEALRSLLVDGALESKWSIVVYAANPLADVSFSKTDRQFREEVRAMKEQLKNGHSSRDNAALRLRVRSLSKMDLVPFFRAGFLLAEEAAMRDDNFFVFAVSSSVGDNPLMSHEESMSVSEVVTAMPLFYGDPPGGKNAELRRYVVKSCNRRLEGNSRLGSDAHVAAEVAKLVSAGAMIQGSNVLHVCALNKVYEFFPILRNHIPAMERLAAVNALDEDGMTPLMALFDSYINPANFGRTFQTAQTLIAYGADKSIVDAFGLSVLGHLRLARQSVHDNSMLLSRRASSMRTILSESDAAESLSVLHARLERLLCPPGGPTPADDAIRDEELD